MTHLHFAPSSLDHRVSILAAVVAAIVVPIIAAIFAQ